jgi:OmpA-OmpF porin, OOP family
MRLALCMATVIGSISSIGCSGSSANVANQPLTVAPPVATEPAGSSTTVAPVSASTRPPVATQFELNGHQVVLPSPVMFETGSAMLVGDSDVALWFLLDYISAKAAVTTLRIEGHVAGAGNAETQLRLSEARAKAVTSWLVNHGVACERLLTAGFGDTKPVADASTPEGRAANTRIEAVNAALRGRAIGGMYLSGGGWAVPTCR